MTKVLLINPSYKASYGGAKASIVLPIMPSLGLAAVAGGVRAKGHDVNILDLSWQTYDYNQILETIRFYGPDIVGLAGTTPLVNQIRDISLLIKDHLPGIKVVAGGAHVTALPTETLLESHLDAVFDGEADFSLAEYCDCGDFGQVQGVFWRDGEKIRHTGRREPIEDLDQLPMPAWDLFDINDYRQISRLLVRRRPVAMAEFSRGCVFKCDFCASKMTMSLGYRKKSPKRCAAEIEHLFKLGYREVMLADDIFTSDQKWAVEVCEAIAATKVDMVWTCTNGIRVESADENLFKAMRRAGCYRVSFGFESGSDEVLKSFGKGGHASIEQGRRAVALARAEGMETNGFFLMGLSPDTEESMTQTIEFARNIPVDVMKFGIAIAFPGTQMFNTYAKKGLVRSYDWDEYFIYTDKSLFAHEHLTYDTIRQYMKRAYSHAMLFNPMFIWRRLVRGIRTGEFFWDVYYGLKFYFMPSVSEVSALDYYARDRWPQFDFSKNPPQARPFQVVRKSAGASAS